ncbi:MAG: serine/threonine protein kinase, partial [Holophagales bacterium]|nr:serine/threonine protein kinase [Holophagales bacterium]
MTGRTDENLETPELEAPETEAWRRADGVLGDLLDLPAGERPAALDALDLEPEVAARVARLLDADAAEHGLLEQGLGPWLDTEAEAPTLDGRRFGPFEVEHEIGRGGMSVVFLARRHADGFEQRVALKILTTAAVTSGARLERETAVLARLRHPHIATLIDAGTETDGTHWLAMEWVEGVSIERHCRQLDARSIVSLFLEVCDAVAYAHRNLVVHRDLKPSNIFVDEEGHVRLLDFGIAKLLDQVDRDASRLRALTPAYAAPEQFDRGDVTTATDVFAMGGVLYRLLSGEPPRSDDARAGTQPSTAPIAAGRLGAEGAAPGTDRDLETVVRMCLRPEPERRYPSASELRQDLERWLQRRPVSAVRDSVAYRLRKLVERNRALAASALALVLAVLVGLASTWWQAQRARAEAERARAEARRATAVTGFLLDLFRFADPDHSQGEALTVRQALDSGARQLALQLGEEPGLRAEMLGTVGEIYHRLGLYDEPGPLLDSAASLA